jgi:hypothetical protein
VPEFIDPIFTKTSPKRSFSVILNERFGLIFAKTGSIISGTVDEGLKSVVAVSVVQLFVDVIQVIVDVGELEQGEISGWHTINTRWVSFTPSTVKGVEALDDF